MKYKLKIFIPNNVFYKEIEIVAENLYEANRLSNDIFRFEFENSGKKNGNFFLEQI